MVDLACDDDGNDPVPPATRRRWSVRLVACVAPLALVLLGAVAVGVKRERQALPEATEQLRLATVASADLLTCFQGVQDDLYVDTAGTTTVASVGDARERLQGCDVDRLAALLQAIDVPPPAPLTTAARRRARAAVEDGAATLHRVVLDARGAKASMAADLSGGKEGSAVVLGVRAVAAGDGRANAQSRVAQFALDQG